MAALDTSIATRLPNEMIEYIAKNLSSPKDILALRTVCKAWANEGERQLYTRRWINISQPEKTWLVNHTLLKKHPLVHVIRSLVLDQNLGWGLTLELNTLIAVVLDLPNLVSIEISAMVVWETDTSAKVSPTVAQSMSNKLRRLVVQGISPANNSGAFQPFQILQLSKSWKRVEFGEISRPALTDGVAEIPEMPAVEVEKLRLIGSDSSEAPIWDRPGGDTGARYLPQITGLKTFKVAVFNVTDVDAVRRTTIANAGTLEVLSLSVPFYVETQRLEIDFVRQATSLQYFALRIPLFGEHWLIDTDNFDQQKWTNFLTTVAFRLPPRLEVIVLYFDFRHKKDETASSAHARMQSHLKFSWKELGYALALCHNLRAVKLAICCDEGCESQAWPHAIADQLEDIFVAFPRFIRSGHIICMYKSKEDRDELRLHRQMATP
ncbi:hypothetical protein EIP86_008282 [Pleurotus ostreatoroseus]|nr:hypothetical protein EIP86_008282 [Pleurotus ostreatoroseus]